MLKMLAAILMAVGLFFGFGESDGKDDSDSRSKVIPKEAADAIKKDGEDFREDMKNFWEDSELREYLTGGWESKEGSLILTEEEREIFEEAVSAYQERDLEPILMISSKVSGGVRYCYLSRAKKKGETKSFALAYVDRNLDGEASLTALTEIGKAAGKSSFKEFRPNMGSFQLSDNDAVSEALDRVVKDISWADVDPVAYIERAYEPADDDEDEDDDEMKATREYGIVCRVTPDFSESDPVFMILYIYDYSYDRAFLTDYRLLDIADLSEEGELSSSDFETKTESETEAEPETEADTL